MDNDKAFNQDIRRTILLSKYILHWGQPEYRIIATKEDNQVEVYLFPSTTHQHVTRIATIGISGILRSNKELAAFEFVMILPKNLGRCSFKEIADLILDIFAYSITYTIKIEVGATILSETIMPKAWPTKALLIDEPHGEPEELFTFHVGNQHINLFWLVPIYKEEQQLIQANGIEAFDQASNNFESSVADPLRPSFC